MIFDCTPCLADCIDYPLPVACTPLTRRTFVCCTPHQAGEAEARFEGKDLNFHKAVRQAFLERAEHNAHRFVIIDGSQSQDQVADAIWSTMQAALNQRHAS